MATNFTNSTDGTYTASGRFQAREGMNVPFLQLKRESASHGPELERAIFRVVKNGWYVLGPELEALESEFAAYQKIPFAVGVGSGTDALTLAFEASGVIERGKNHEVITSALSAAFSALAIWRAGAVPRFVDVDSRTLQIDPAQIESSIGERTRAILPVHLYGNACDLRRIDDLARKHELLVIEDACQAHGSRLNDVALGTWGRAAGFSFYPTKNLGALGDGGMVVTHEEEICRRVKKLRHGGQDRTGHHEMLGCNSRLDEIQAAVLRYKLKTLESRNEARRQMAARYDEAFADLDLTVLPAMPGMIPNRHLYAVRTPRREELRRHLAELGVETLVHYPIPLPCQPALQRFVLPGQRFPMAERAAREVFSLPLYPELTEAEHQHVIRAVRRFFKK
jgi:dTDP-4-amino-4,6-dideoxygalactose transaminase